MRSCFYRADLARAIEKWGGVSQLATELAYGIAPRVTGARQAPVKPDQEAVSGRHDNDDGVQSKTVRIHANPVSDRVRAVAMAVHRDLSRAEQKQTRHVVEEPPMKFPSPADMSRREKQPIVNVRRRIALRQKTPKLPSMRTEIDGW